MDKTGKSIIILASMVIIAAGIKAAEDLIVPFLLAVFISILASTPIFWLQAKKVPRWLAILLVSAGVIVSLIALGTIVAQSADLFLERVPYYQERLTAGLIEPLKNIDPTMENFQLVLAYFDPGIALDIAGTVIGGLGEVLSNSFLILLTVVFILAEGTSIPQKIQALLSRPEVTMPYFIKFTENVNRYLAIKTSTSVLTGVTVALGLSIIGVDFPLLWGILSFFLNFIPTIGSIIAAVPAIVLALIQLGPVGCLLTLVLYVVINVFVGNGLEPKFMGRGLGLSTLVVFLSLIFWGWMLGPVGMLLSVPLTITAKLAMEANPSTVWLATLLSPPNTNLSTTSSGEEANGL